MNHVNLGKITKLTIALGFFFLVKKNQVISDQRLLLEGQVLVVMKATGNHYLTSNPHLSHYIYMQTHIYAGSQFSLGGLATSYFGVRASIFTKSKASTQVRFVILDMADISRFCICVTVSC